MIQRCCRYVCGWIAVVLFTGVAVAGDGPNETQNSADPSAKMLLIEFRNRIRSASEQTRDGVVPLPQLLQKVQTEIAKLHKKKELQEFYAAKTQSDEQKLRAVFDWLLQRPPTEAEMRNALQYIKRSKDRKDAWGDIVWALANSREFMLKK